MARAGRRDSQRETLPLVQHVRSQRKTAFLTQDADSLVTSTCRQECALPRDPGKFVDDVASAVGDVVPISGRRPQEVQLRTERPPTGSCVTVDQPFGSQGREQSVRGGPSEAGELAQLRGGSARWFGRAEGS